jgi:predicted Zn-dependent protease with MMP-like domain
MQLPTDEEFSKLIGNALDELPEKYISRLQNVVITYADEPDDNQRKKLKLRSDQSLVGLYEGIPLTQRTTQNYNGVVNFQLPDKITLFKLPLFHFSAGDESKFKAQIKHTLWHEIAHYFGLDHTDIHDREEKQKNKT